MMLGGRDVRARAGGLVGREVHEIDRRGQRDTQLQGAVGPCVRVERGLGERGIARERRKAQCSHG